MLLTPQNRHIFYFLYIYKIYKYTISLIYVVTDMFFSHVTQDMSFDVKILKLYIILYNYKILKGIYKLISTFLKIPRK
jgi:hypothetical protein